MRAVAAVDNNLRKGFVHRHKDARITLDAPFIAQCLPQALPQANPDILDGMVIIDFDIAMRFHRQIKMAMLGKQVQHMIEERHIGQ
ncbi:hypothetical protein D3C76_1688740 [compost metagenome]